MVRSYDPCFRVPSLSWVSQGQTAFGLDFGNFCSLGLGGAAQQINRPICRILKRLKHQISPGCKQLGTVNRAVRGGSDLPAEPGGAHRLDQRAAGILLA